MNKTAFVLLSICLLLAACTVPPVTRVPAALTAMPELPSTGATQPPLTTPIPTVTEILPTSTPTTLRNSAISLSYFTMVNADQGWAAGKFGGNADLHDYLFRTDDGGSTWHNVTPKNAIIYDVVGLDASNAWIASPSPTAYSAVVVWHTRDGGRSWSSSAPFDHGVNADFLRLQFIDPQHGWLVIWEARSNGTIELLLRTGDGGITWEPLLTTNCPLIIDKIPCESPVFIDRYTGWRTRTDGFSPVRQMRNSPVWQVLRTRDAGHTWRPVSLPIPRDLLATLADDKYSQSNIQCNSRFVRVDLGMLAIEMGCNIYEDNPSLSPLLLSRSYQYMSSDGGREWDYFPTTDDLIIFVDRFIRWRLTVPDGHTLERTTDAGITWQTMNEQLPWESGFQFIDADHGWVLVNKDRLTLKELWRTFDGGKTWEEIKPVVAP